MAEALISSMTGSFDPSEFTDEYRAALTALLEAKQTGGEVVQPEEPEDTGGAVVDLMSALRRSVERARGGSADEEAPPAKRTAAKKAPAKKAAARSGDGDGEKTAPAKRTAAAKKAPAKKAAAKTAAAKSDDAKPAKRARRSA
jgi:DNA end-binding protein Ku